VDLGDVATGKLHDCGTAMFGDQWRYEHNSSQLLTSCQRCVQIVYFVSRDFSSIGKMEMAIGDDDYHLSELRFDSDTAVRSSRTSDLYAGGLRFVRDDSSVSEREERLGEGIDAVR